MSDATSARLEGEIEARRRLAARISQLQADHRRRMAQLDQEYRERLDGPSEERDAYIEPYRQEYLEATRIGWTEWRVHEKASAEVRQAAKAEAQVSLDAAVKAAREELLGTSE